MIHPIKSAAIFVAILVLVVSNNVDSSQAQMPLPVYVSPTPIVAVKRPFFHHHAYYTSVVPVQVSYPAYYAPQVPVVPMASGPVPTMSAYYVPTVPVTQTYYAPVVSRKWARHHAVPVVPSVVYPVYWYSY